MPKDDQLGLDFDPCRRRHRGNEESEAAYNSTKVGKEAQLAEILDYIRSRGTTGATADEVSEALDIYIQTASARCSELKARDLVFKYRTRPTRRGNSAAVLVAKEHFQATISGIVDEMRKLPCPKLPNPFK